jgi:hypothetical protein
VILLCCSSMSELWYEPSWDVNYLSDLIWLIAKGYVQIVLDVLVDVSEVILVLLLCIGEQNYGGLNLNNGKVNVKGSHIYCPMK